MTAPSPITAPKPPEKPQSFSRRDTASESGKAVRVDPGASEKRRRGIRRRGRPKRVVPVVVQPLPPEGAPDRYAFFMLPRCRKCDATELTFDHTTKNANGVKENQHTTCLACGHRFIAVWE
jgi:DNA-directed RNA polymerase subunit M/transcription elongation factor TFIIS